MGVVTQPLSRAAIKIDSDIHFIENLLAGPPRQKLTGDDCTIVRLASGAALGVGRSVYKAPFHASRLVHLR